MGCSGVVRIRKVMWITTRDQLVEKKKTRNGTRHAAKEEESVEISSASCMSLFWNLMYRLVLLPQRRLIDIISDIEHSVRNEKSLGVPRSVLSRN